MNRDRIQKLNACGQSVWLDTISRHLLRTGMLAGLIDDGCITGVTANPTIFQKAINESSEYDETICRMAEEGRTPLESYERLALEDVGEAADLFRPIYNGMGGADGFVSIEVSPELAHDTEGTISEARRFWQELSRRNIMIKVPATPAGIPAIEELTAEGINVNITLIFAVEVYEEVMQAYLRGLQRRMQAGQPFGFISSVASFFVSRVDTLVDQRLDEKAQSAGDATRARLERLKGKAAVANAKIAYERFEQVFFTDEFRAWMVGGAQVQRPLWASTGTKNPAYPDTLYVDSLVGAHTVNTMPFETLEAFVDHGTVECNAICEGRAEANAVIRDLAAVGIQMKDVTDQLTREGVEKFSTSLRALEDAIEQRQGAMAVQ